ncbi:MAG: hypothetical protein UR43_C0019G0011 [candidate division TM6 bacterium GW2011_GWF2_33_332]|nr:MAG: hypothetical protein UR43_C0019G0011 [candidate division TM6 bacterium GW2011_GWF2_33_332]
MSDKKIEIIVDAKELLKGTSYPDLKPQEPFIITAPPIYERSFEDYQDGKACRRERRLKKRNKPTEQ